MNQKEIEFRRQLYEKAQQLFWEALQVQPESIREDWVKRQQAYGDELIAIVVAMLREDKFDQAGEKSIAITDGSDQTIAYYRDTTDSQKTVEFPKIPNYEILELIDRGGMGVVYKARQLRPNRLVAIKMIRGGTFASSTDIERFLVEAEAASQLDSESVIPVYEVGVVNGEPFIAMKYIEGENLEVLLEQRAMAIPVILNQLIAICRAVAVAHDRGIIHRDIKPSNILVERVSGRPWVTDFGLAKYLERDSSATAAGDVVGTPGYMAPELALGDSKNATRAVDVYGLGAILYRALTGRPPIPTESANLITMIERIREHEVLAPRKIHRRVPQALNTICMKCLETDPVRRYPNAKELADDLQRFLDDEPIHAKPLGWTRRLHRWARHRPGLAVTWCGLAIFYVYHLLCYQLGLYPDPQFHAAATSLGATAAMSALVWQVALTRTQGAAWVLYAWVTCDLALLTILLFWAISANSSLVLLYHVIVAGSVLRCRKALVVYVTVAALMGYSIHLLYLWFDQPQEVPEIHQAVPTILSLVLIGIVQYFALLKSGASFEAKGVMGSIREIGVGFQR